MSVESKAKNIYVYKIFKTRYSGYASITKTTINVGFFNICFIVLSP